MPAMGSATPTARFGVPTMGSATATMRFEVPTMRLATPSLRLGVPAEPLFSSRSYLPSAPYRFRYCSSPKFYCSAESRAKIPWCNRCSCNRTVVQKIPHCTWNNCCRCATDDVSAKVLISSRSVLVIAGCDVKDGKLRLRVYRTSMSLFMLSTDGK
jgi:hypothetical protein